MDRFVGREDDIRNITGYLDFTSSDVQVVHIVGPPGFGKSTLAKKIGEILLREWVKVHYVDVRMIKDTNTLAEKVMRSAVESMKKKVTFDRLEKWVWNQFSNTLIILDNCDELLEYTQDKFLEAIRLLTVASSRKRVRFILTSQRKITDIGNFIVHSIYNLSTEASIELLGRVASGLTMEQMTQIADLTGNVPLALDVIGAIFNYPGAPTAEEVIEGLKKDAVTTLSPKVVHSKVNVPFHLAYSYLAPQLQQLCVNLTYFPGTFTGESFSAIFNHDVDMIDTLVERSLLQCDRGSRLQKKVYYFHQLIKTFFRQVADTKISFLPVFNCKFQHYFTQILEGIVNDYEKHLKLDRLDDEKQNIHHMFILFKTVKHVNYTFSGVQIALNAMRVLHLRFLSTEIHTFSLDMLKALDSYTSDEQASVPSFLETYTELLMLVAKQLKPSNAMDAIEILTLKEKRIDEGYKKGLLKVKSFTKFYYVLADYYKEMGNVVQSSRYHAHIISTIHGQLRQCSHSTCEYYSISVAYDNIHDRIHAFEFRKLAYEHQLTSLDDIARATLILKLYNDHLNVSVGNNAKYAEILARIIIEEIYPYLMNTILFYPREVYYLAVEFFLANNMEEHAIDLQFKMTEIIHCNESEMTWDENSEYFKHLKKHFKELATQKTEHSFKHSFKCAIYYLEFSSNAYKRQCYHLAVWLGNKTIHMFDEAHLNSYPWVGFGPSIILGMTHYELRNYSMAQMYLRHTLKHINEISKLSNEQGLEMRGVRATTCFYLLKSGDILNLLCYGYMYKYFIYVVAAQATEELYVEEVQNEEIQLSTATAVTEQTHNYIWSQLKSKINVVHLYIEEKWLRTLNELVRDNLPCFLIFYIGIVLTSCCIYYCCTELVICIAIRCMSCCCIIAEQKIWCLKCMYCCRHLCFLSIFLFLICLDWLY